MMEEATNIQNTNETNATQQETKWYVLRVVSGKERKVKEYIENEISREGGTTLKASFLTG
jgi:transcriptional antiterminator NusG